MLQYQHYEAEDFATDEAFRQWVLEPDPESVHFWENWLLRHPHQTDTVRKARQLVLAVHAEVQQAPAESVQRTWQTIETHTLEKKTPQNIPEKERTLGRNRMRFYRMAASLLLLLVAGSLLYFFRVKSPASQSYATQFGEIQRITLPDGSEVTLNANSTLSFGKNWEDKSLREVFLKGEAYFSVKEKERIVGGKKAKIKFVVNTSDVRVEVLGTQFNVTNRRNNTAVVLRSGKVRLGLNGNGAESEVVMKPGDLVSYSSQAQSLQKKTVDPDQYDTWKEKRWVFTRATLEEIALRLEETYGMPVRWDNDFLKRRTISGNIPTDNLDRVLQALSVSMNLQIVQENNQIIIRE